MYGLKNTAKKKILHEFNFFVSSFFKRITISLFITRALPSNLDLRKEGTLAISGQYFYVSQDSPVIITRALPSNLDLRKEGTLASSGQYFYVSQDSPVISRKNPTQLFFYKNSIFVQLEKYGPLYK